MVQPYDPAAPPPIPVILAQPSKEHRLQRIHLRLLRRERRFQSSQPGARWCARSGFAAPLQPGLRPSRIGDHSAWVEDFLWVLCLNPPVTVAQLLEVSARLVENAASDLAEPFQTVVVWERWVGVHRSISSNSSGVINCGVCKPSV